jgi:replicative DNA helicase
MRKTRSGDPEHGEAPEVLDLAALEAPRGRGEDTGAPERHWWEQTPGRLVSPLDVLVSETVAAQRSEGVEARWPTGTRGIDELIGGGLLPGDLVVLAGAPGAGRTDLALRWGRALARADVPVLIASFTADERTVLERLLRQELEDLPLRDRTPEQANAALEEVSEQLALSGPLRRGDRASIEAAILRHLGDGGLLVVDDLGKAGARSSARALAVPAAEQLKALALQHGIAIVACHGVRAEALDDDQPMLRDLIDAESVAYESDLVLILGSGRPRRAAGALPRGGNGTQLLVARNRRGPVGTEIPVRHRDVLRPLGDRRATELG